MELDIQSFPLTITPNLEAILVAEIGKADIPEGKGVSLNFWDPEYSVTKEGYRPVQITIAANGNFLYLTDFVLIGMPPAAELVREFDFDASMGLFRHGGTVVPLEEGESVFDLWQRNFCVYYRMGVFRVQSEPV